MSRRMAVAGQFYPADARRLRSTIQSATPSLEGEPTAALGALCPHAGYPFSGGVAAGLFARVRVPDAVLLLTPSHAYAQPAFALWTGGAWETPLGSIALHEGLTDALSRHPHVTPADEPHLPEHSGEVVLPFLQYHNPDVRIAVVCVTASARLPQLKEVGTFAATALADLGEGDALVVASSDMSHERGPGALKTVQEHDALAVAEMEKLDPDGLHAACSKHRITMCGRLPAVAMMTSAAARGATRGTVMGRATSADSPHGGGDYIVGYAGMVFN